MTKFKLEIELGNEAMQSVGDVRRALHYISEKLAMLPNLEFIAEMDEYDTHLQIRDESGNLVGHCEVV